MSDVLCSQRAYGKVSVGSHMLRGAPRLDQGRYRWVVTRNFLGGEEVGQWAEDDHGRMVTA